MISTTQDLQYFELHGKQLDEFNETKMQEFKDLFLNTDQSVDEIFEKIGVAKSTSTYRWIIGNRKQYGCTAKDRDLNFEVKELTTEERYAELEEFYQKFKEIWLSDPKISKKKVYEQLGRTQQKELTAYVNARMEEDNLPEHYKSGRKKNPKKQKCSIPASQFEDKYRQYKELFENSTLEIKDIYKKLGVPQNNNECYHYIHAKAKEEGLNGYARQRGLAKKRYESNYEEWEAIFQEYKELFLTTDYTIREICNKLDIPFYAGKSALRRYILKRAKEEGLDGRTRPHIKRQDLDKEKAEKVYQEYKQQFTTTKKPLSQIYTELDITYGTKLYNYIKDRQEEDGLTNDSRRDSKNKKKKKSQKSSNKSGKKSNYSDKALKMVEDSRSTLQKMYSQRNINDATIKGYEAVFVIWCEYTKDRFNNLQEMLDFYIAEEKERVPMRDRTFKNDLLGFREYMHSLDTIKSDRSFNTYFSKLKTIFNHFEIEMPSLPRMKMHKGYISNYNDLPTHAMIKSACEQSPLDLKSIILFMSSSGTAKAEALSIEVGWFLKGCEEYLDKKPTSNNIPDTLEALSDKHYIVPTIYLRRIKTDKWYHTYCSPEASYMIIESLKTRKNLKWTDKLFDFTSSLLLTKFQEINDNNDWGYVGAYRRFRSHALRKFMASNIGLARDQVDSIQGRSKDEIQEAYFKQDPKSMKKVYMSVMERVMVYNNWGYGINAEELEKRRKRLYNDFKDDEKIVDLSSTPCTPDEIKTSIGLGEDDKATLVSRDASSKKPNQANSMPITPPAQVPVGCIPGSISISEELLNYAKLMDMGLISIAEFNRIKQKLLGSMLR